jgi:hypothetical protein
MAEPAGMSLATALIRAGYMLDRYAGCDSRVLRVISAADLDAVEVLADTVRNCDWCPASRQVTEANDDPPPSV